MHVVGNNNPNVEWLESRGFYVFYLLFLAVFHLILLSLLSFSVLSIAWIWSITNISHNLANLYFLHFVKGTPWYTSDILTPSGGYKRETHFEQLDSSSEFSWTSQKKFLFVMPIILFLLTCLYTQNSETHFLANFISLVIVQAPKLPSFHGLRILGINKY